MFSAELAKQASGGTRGARDLRNVLRRKIEDKIASLIVDHVDSPLKSIYIDAQDGEIILTAA